MVVVVVNDKRQNIYSAHHALFIYYAAPIVMYIVILNCALVLVTERGIVWHTEVLLCLYLLHAGIASVYDA